MNCIFQCRIIKMKINKINSRFVLRIYYLPQRSDGKKPVFAIDDTH